MTDYWRPHGPTRRGSCLPLREPGTGPYPPASATRRHEDAVATRLAARGYVQLAPGVLVVWQRQPWRVVETAERPLDLWGEKYEAEFARAEDAWERWGRGPRPERATWPRRPVAVVVVPDRQPKAKPLHLIGPACHSWTVLPEHYSVCVACGELPPCQHELAEREADRQMARTEVLMEIPAGHCLGCGEPITSRMKAVRFPGENLWRPDLGDNSAVFHARQECAVWVDRYREAWEARGGTDTQLPLPAADSGEGAQP